MHEDLQHRYITTSFQFNHHVILRWLVECPVIWGQRRCLNESSLPHLIMADTSSSVKSHYSFWRVLFKINWSKAHSFNWANVCLPNILRTVWRTMIRFLIELLVRWTWFGQFDELYFVLNGPVMRCKLRPELWELACNEMQASTRTCVRRVADSTIENVG